VATVVGDQDPQPLGPIIANKRTQLENAIAPELAPTELGEIVDDGLNAKTVLGTGAQPSQAPVRASQMQVAQPPGSAYPVVQGGRPFSADLAPSDPPMPQRSRYSSEHIPAPHSGTQSPVPGAGLHTPRPASTVSPVGEHYPPRDWQAEAERRVRPMQPWMLAVLFVGALGIALTITIVIAKIIR
jgi:hypothetical protein